MPLHPQAKVIADLLASFGAPPLSSMSPDEARVAYAAMNVPSSEAVHEIRDVDAGGVPARLYRPSADSGLGLLVFFHGGGWVIGNLDSHDGVCRSLANRSGHAVLSIDYRLAPEHKFPAALDDCLTATRWAHDNAASLGVDASRIAVGGDSAGGNLAAAVAQARPVPLRLQVLIYPATDARMSMPSIEENKDGPLLTKDTMEWFFRQYIDGSADASDPRVSPMLADDSTLAGVAPALVVTAEFDPLRDEGEAYGRRLAGLGVPATVVRMYGQFHGFFNMLEALDDAHAAHAITAQALRRAFAD